jgi:uncharacterized protein
MAVNRFNGELAHYLDDVRWALALNDDTPLVTFDARVLPSVPIQETRQGPSVLD